MAHILLNNDFNENNKIKIDEKVKKISDINIENIKKSNNSMNYDRTVRIQKIDDELKNKYNDWTHKMTKLISLIVLLIIIPICFPIIVYHWFIVNLKVSKSFGIMTLLSYGVVMYYYYRILFSLFEKK